MLESYDNDIANRRDKKKYRDKGKRTTCIKTVYGPVEYQRRIYGTTTESGEKAYVYLLDEEMLEYIKTYATSVESPDEKDNRSKKAQELYKYLV